MLHGDRLHVGGSVDDSQAQAVHRQSSHEDISLRGARDGSEPDGLQDEPGPQGAGTAPVLGGQLGEGRPGAGEQHHHEQEPGDEQLREVPPGQPGGQRDEQQALHGEGGSDGGAVPGQLGGGRRRGGGTPHPATVADPQVTRGSMPRRG
jgi:hypothetical protein